MRYSNIDDKLSFLVTKSSNIIVSAGRSDLCKLNRLTQALLSRCDKFREARYAY